MSLQIFTRTQTAGVDEAGRGPLAGPVVAAAVILPEGFDVRGLGDSKALSREQREAVEPRIKAETTWCIQFVEPSVIDEINILQATFLAMKRAIEGLTTMPERVLIDGNQVPPGLMMPGEAIIKGDAKEACISAASILAKCARDRFMVETDLEYPEYGFASHFGYGTPEHLEAIRVHGPCPIHRMTFSPLRPELQLCLTLDQ